MRFHFYIQFCVIFNKSIEHTPHIKPVIHDWNTHLLAFRVVETCVPYPLVLFLSNINKQNIFPNITYSYTISMIIINDNLGWNEYPGYLDNSLLNWTSGSVSLYLVLIKCLCIHRNQTCGIETVIKWRLISVLLHVSSFISI